MMADDADLPVRAGEPNGEDNDVLLDDLSSSDLRLREAIVGVLCHALSACL